MVHRTKQSHKIMLTAQSATRLHFASDDRLIIGGAISVPLGYPLSMHVEVKLDFLDRFELASFA